jgi:hypothetical protein
MGAYEYQSKAVAPPTASDSTTTPVVCTGTTINLYGNGGQSYAWSSPAGSNYGSGSRNPSFTASTMAFNGIYTVTVSNTTYPLTVTNTVSVQVVAVLSTSVVVSINIALIINALWVNNVLPNAQNTVGVCNNVPVMLNIAATNGVVYSWRGPTGAGSGFTTSLVSSVNMPIASPRQGQYTVTVRLLSVQPAGH